jgi:hypothetical protein
MKNIYILILLIAGIFFLNACEKDTSIFVPDPGQLDGPDTNWYASLAATMPFNTIKSSLLLQPELDSFEVNGYADTVITSSGMQCIFPPNSFIDSEGNKITGNVYLETYILKKKGDIINMSLPTTSNGSLLVSGGAIYLSLKQGMNELNLAPGMNAHIRYSDTAVSSLMKLFMGDGSNSGEYNWLPIADTFNNNNSVYAGNDEYEIITNQLHWISCNYFYKPTISQTLVSVSLSANNHLTNANTLAYLVFNNIRSVIPMQGDVTTKKFISSNVPVGENVTIVTISKDGDYYYLGHTNLITTSQQPVSSVATQNISINPENVSIGDIQNYLNSL